MSEALVRRVGFPPHKNRHPRLPSIITPYLMNCPGRAASLSRPVHSLLVCFMLLAGGRIPVAAQAGKALVQNAPAGQEHETVIQIKWYAGQLTFAEGGSISTEDPHTSSPGPASGG